ncbi:MAG: polymer-forming cytoskeletal protein [Anaeromyxobacteraceae bacterium]
MTGARRASYPAAGGEDPTNDERQNAGAPGTATVVAPGATVEGDVSAKGDVVVHGTVRGRVTGEGTVRIGPEAVVEGDVCAPRVVIVDGATFRGTVDTSGEDPAAEPVEAPVPEPAPDAGLRVLSRRISLRGK